MGFDMAVPGAAGRLAAVAPRTFADYHAGVVSSPAKRPQLIDLTLEAPEENLALDEALFRGCEAEVADGRETAFLRFWESPSYFVVLGVSSRLRQDVHTERCRTGGVPVLRRISGGGTVLQGPGCLNFTLVLPLSSWPEMRRLESSYRAVVERVAAATGLPGARLQGTCDLAVGDLKVGGSAQKRSRSVLLHQGTILFAFDLERIPLYLKEPIRRPEYRAARGHLEFLANARLAPEEIRARLASAWGAEPAAGDWELPPLAPLIDQRYGRREWTERF